MIRNNVTHHGFTLIELIITVVVLGIGATAFTILINQTTRASVDPLLRVQANAIAQSYLEEILSQAFCDPNFSTDCPNNCNASACSNCTVADAGRPNFNDVCDYQAVNDAGAVDRNGILIPGLGTYNVTVTVDDSASLGGLSGGAGEVLRVDVSVTHGSLPGPVNLSGYRVNF
jgi:MSHA pilin protein MshD